MNIKPDKHSKLKTIVLSMSLKSNLEHAKKELPRDVYLKIVGNLCCDMDSRIRLGLVRKLHVPDELKERLQGLARPTQFTATPC